MDTYCKYRRDLAGLRIACAPTTRNPAAMRLPTTFPSVLVFRAQDTARPLTRGLSLVYLPLDRGTPTPSPPLRIHLPINALARLTIPLGRGLSRFPLVLKTPPWPGTNIPPAAVITQTYAVLRQRARQKVLDGWAEHFPTPSTTPTHRASPHTPSWASTNSSLAVSIK